MARPHLRDVVTWVCTLPASAVLVACLFLPQVEDCNGNVKTAFDTGTWPMLIALAVIGVLPLAWRWPPLRRPILLVVGVATATILIMTVLGIPVLIVLAVARSLNDEEAAALCCFTIVLAFVLMFPIAMVLGRWLQGAQLAWGAAWLQLAGTMWWLAGASDRGPG